MPKVRILIDTRHGEDFYPINSVADLPDDLLPDAIANGWADPSDAAVAYAEQLAAEAAAKAR